MLDRVQVSQMPDLPLLIGKGANAQAVPLRTAVRRRRLPSRRNWSRRHGSANAAGTSASSRAKRLRLPEGEALASAALVKFAKMDKSAGLLGRGILRFDLRIPGKMTVRLPREPGEPIVPNLFPRVKNLAWPPIPINP